MNYFCMANMKILLIFTLILLSGCWNQEINTSYYDNGAIKTKAVVSNGVLDGPAYSYYENGVVSSSANYKAGVLHGESKAFSIDKKVVSIANYKNGVLHGLSMRIDASGNVIEVFFEDGILTSQ